ncbi:MAG: hypothetical protein LAN62_10675 [Acidobacteriia bacterium]|nr:hypothetical protein [Terriglobia bacterium]
MRLLRKIVVVLVVVYLVLFAGLFAAMFQPPEVFGRIMSKMPGLVFPLFPFKRMWLFARSGRLKVGEPAPNFDLKTVDKKSHVRLSSFRGQRPVVLVFGSYT